MKSYKNISCLLSLSDAQHIVRKSAKYYGKENVAILKEPTLDMWLGISLQLTYIKRFEQVIQYITEAGLVEKWFKTDLFATYEREDKSNDMNEKHDRNKSNKISQLVIVWVGEMIVPYGLKVSICFPNERIRKR